MAVRIRMQRFGRRNRPFYRIVATDARAPRDGRALETLGTYNPIETDQKKVVTLDEERVRHWLAVGAQPSETATSIFKRAGILLPWVERDKEKRAAAVAERRKAKGKPPREAGTRKRARGTKPKPGVDAEGKEVDLTSRKARREAKRASR